MGFVGVVIFVLFVLVAVVALKFALWLGGVTVVLAVIVGLAVAAIVRARRSGS